MKPINKTKFHNLFQMKHVVDCEISDVRFVIAYVDSLETKRVWEEALYHQGKLEIGETYAIRYLHEDNGIEGYYVEVFKVKDLLLDLRNLQDSIFKIYTKIRPPMDDPSENTILHHPV